MQAQPSSRNPLRSIHGAVAVGCLLAAGLASHAAETMYKPKAATAGGLDPRPQVHSMAVADGTAAFTVEGLQPPYQLQGSEDPASGDWLNLGDPVPGGTHTIPVEDQLGFLRVQGPNPNYIGAAQCSFCHNDQYAPWSGTAHSHAFDTLKHIGMDKNSRCIECHTVGYGLESGFKSEAATPNLAGVQCENCHGPGGNPHWMDASVLPKTTLSAEVCGGCHNDAHHPTFDEWKESRHSHMDSHVAGYFQDPNTGQARMFACGPCHSGAVRMSMLKAVPDYISPAEERNLDLLPTGEDAAHFTVTCAVCHDPHANTISAQLRNPTYSTNFFSYSTSTTTHFAAQYNPNVQLCGQCHNQRGARWQDSARPPHHSPQYNILVGQVATPGTADGDVLNGGLHQHGDQLLQCVQCHTHGHEVDDPTESNPNFTGHTFEPTALGCIDCHTLWNEAAAEAVIGAVQDNIKARIQEVKAVLDNWGLTKSPEPLRSQYGALAWEFNSAGQLSNPDGSLRGPTNAEQSAIPDEIKKARFLLYLVEHDASFGLHNPTYTQRLLDDSQAFAEQAP